MELRRKTTRQRGLAPRARRLLVGVVVVLVAAAAPAWSAQVVDVRVGKHAGFSRVVFELDSPVGYKVERGSPTSGVNELVISLDASAQAQILGRRLDFIEKVEVVPGAGNRSTVRIQLKGDDLKLKEMILANPPRIVLDVLSTRAMARAAQADADAKARASAKSKAEQAARAAKQKEEAAALAANEAELEARKAAEIATPQPPASMPAPGAGDRPTVSRDLAMVTKQIGRAHV